MYVYMYVCMHVHLLPVCTQDVYNSIYSEVDGKMHTFVHKKSKKDRLHSNSREKRAATRTFARKDSGYTHIRAKNRAIHERSREKEWRAYTYTHSHTHTHTHTVTDTHTQTYTHRHTHTQTHT